MIDNLIVKNFKCLKDARINTKALTVLTGLNGMGKSTVIQSLLLLRQSKLASHKSGIPRLLLNGPLVNIGTARDALCEGTDDESISLEITVEGKKFLWKFCYEECDDELKAAPQHEHALLPRPTGLFSDQFHYLRAERIGPRPTFPLSVATVRDQRQLGRDGDFTPFFLNTFATEEILSDLLIHKDGSSRQLRHQVEAWLGEISPGIRIFPESHSEMDVVNLQYAFTSKSGESNHYRASNVGFGLTYCLSILVAVLSSKPGALLLIENPEAHLHPKGQSQIGRLLALAAMSGIQIFIETHSDHILNGIRVAVHAGEITPEKVALHYFSLETIEGVTAGRQTKITSPTIDKDGRLSEWPEGFFDEADKLLRKLLTPAQRK